MGKNKGKNGGDGHQKSSSLACFVRSAQQQIASQQQEQQEQQQQRQGWVGRLAQRPLLDVMRVRTLLDSCSDSRGDPICTNAPFTNEFLKQYEFQKEREAARKTDLNYYHRLEALFLNASASPLPLQVQCISAVARHQHHASSLTFLLPALTPLQNRLVSLALCRYNRLTPAALECLAESCPDTLVCSGAAIHEQQLLSALHLSLRLSNDGMFRDSWEEADADFLDFRPAPLRPLHASLLQLHLVGCTLSVPGLRTVASLCTLLTDLSLHRLTIDGVQGYHLDWHDVLCSVFLQAFRSSQWCLDGEGVGDGDWSTARTPLPNDYPPAPAAPAAPDPGAAGAAAAVRSAGSFEAPFPASFPSLRRLEFSHCWPTSATVHIMQAFALSLFVSKRARHAGLGALEKLTVFPIVQSPPELRAQFQLSRVTFLSENNCSEACVD